MASGFEVAGTDLDSIFAPYVSGWPQANATGLKVSGTDLNTRYAPLSSGTAANTTNFKVSGTDLNEIFAAIGTTGVIVETQPSAVSGATAAGRPSGTVTSDTTTCAGARGKGSYTYTWNIVSGSASFTAGSSATTGVTGDIDAGATDTGTMNCTISDGTTSVNTETVDWSLQNTTPASSGNFVFDLGEQQSGTAPDLTIVWGYSSSGLGVLVSEDVSWGTPTAFYTELVDQPSTATTFLEISTSTNPGADAIYQVEVSATGGASYGTLLASDATYTYSDSLATWTWNNNNFWEDATNFGEYTVTLA